MVIALASAPPTKNPLEKTCRMLRDSYSSFSIADFFTLRSYSSKLTESCFSAATIASAAYMPACIA